MGPRSHKRSVTQTSFVSSNTFNASSIQCTISAYADRYATATALQLQLHQYINTSIHQHINTSIHQHINTSIHQYINTSIHQYINTPNQTILTHQSHAELPGRRHRASGDLGRHPNTGSQAMRRLACQQVRLPSNHACNHSGWNHQTAAAVSVSTSESLDGSQRPIS
jgi:hypothetical protein